MQMCLRKVISQGSVFPHWPSPLPEADLISFSIMRLLRQLIQSLSVVCISAAHLSAVASILKCLCNNFRSAGVFWLLKILIRLASIATSCPMENLISSQRFLPGLRRLSTSLMDILTLTSYHWGTGAFHSVLVLIPYLYSGINTILGRRTFP